MTGPMPPQHRTQPTYLSPSNGIRNRGLNMNIAYTMAAGRGDTDLLLAGVAETLLARGRTPCGTVQINTGRKGDHRCDMDVRVLPAGPVIRISQALGRASRGCRLDPAALEAAVAQVQADLATGADLLVVNKFGKHEAEGRGFRPVIADALALGLPVLVGVNRLNRQAFLDFTDGLAVPLAPVQDTILTWIETYLPARAA